jgi:hypothetical protein
MERTTALQAVEAKEIEEEMKVKNERGEEEDAPGEDDEGAVVDEEGEEGASFTGLAVCTGRRKPPLLPSSCAIETARVPLSLVPRSVAGECTCAFPGNGSQNKPLPSTPGLVQRDKASLNSPQTR